MRRGLSIALLALATAALAACSTTPLTPAQDSAALASVPRIEGRAAAVQGICARIQKLAPLANAIPEAGPAIALAAEVGCFSASGAAGLVADPAGAERLARAEETIKAAIARARLTIQ